MIDTYYRDQVQRLFITPVATKLAALQVSPSQLTGIALILGLSITPLLAFQHPYLAIVCLVLSGYFDTLDGTVARQNQSKSSTGAVFDIVSDRAVESAIILGLFLVDPTGRGLLAICMLCSILLCITSFLVVGIFTENESEKSFNYHPGIMERSEAFIFFGSMILFPSFFTALSISFTLLVLTTALYRVYQFAQSNR
jgi:archaetidylinositol phosphate synthase